MTDNQDLVILLFAFIIAAIAVIFTLACMIEFGDIALFTIFVWLPLAFISYSKLIKMYKND